MKNLVVAYGLRAYSTRGEDAKRPYSEPRMRGSLMIDRQRIILVLLLLPSLLPGCGVDTCRNESCLSIEGCVRYRDGNAIEGVKIYGYADPPEGPMPVPACSTRTEGGGAYSLPFPSEVRELIVVPSREGCVFSPSSRFWRPDDDRQDFDFSVYCGEAYLVDGHVWGRGGPGHPYPGVLMYMETSVVKSGEYTATDEAGYYVFNDLCPLFDYEIAPSIYCPEYSPASRVIENPEHDYHGQDFTAVTPEFVYITGCVRDPYGAPQEGVTLECTYRRSSGEHVDAPDTLTRTLQISVETGPDGRYRIHTMSCRYVEVRPAVPGCFAVPQSRSYEPRNDIDGEDYTLYCTEGYTISGHLKNEHGEPIQNMAVAVSGQAFGWYEVRSYASGYYEIMNLPWGLDYEVRPSRCPSSCTCEPARREYEHLARDYSDQDFVITFIH